MIEILPGVFRYKLPLAREVAAFAARGGRSLVDLTQRPRGTIERACAKHGVAYHKFPMPYSGGDADGAARLVLSLPRPVLFHCFHGRDRTGAVAEIILATR